MTKSVNLGAFLSSAKGFLHMGKEAKEADMQTMSFFLRNPRGRQGKTFRRSGYACVFGVF